MKPTYMTVRRVQIEGYQLHVWDTGEVDTWGKTILAYRFTGPQGDVLFDGADFHCALSHAIDSDACMRSLLGFLVLRPGDTDAEYFAHYTPAQMAFAESVDAELLQSYVDGDAAIGDMPECRRCHGGGIRVGKHGYEACSCED